MDIYFGPQFEKGGKIMLRIEDFDSEIVTEYITCPDCDGSGGYDAATDIEEYEDWQDCMLCEGRGVIEQND